MTTALDEIVNHTNSLLVPGNLAPPNKTDLNRRIEALCELGLNRQVDAVRTGHANHHAEKYGFVKMTLSEAVVALMGEDFTKKWISQERHFLEYSRFMRPDGNPIASLSCMATRFSRGADTSEKVQKELPGIRTKKKKIKKKSLPPKWSLKMGCLDYLSNPIPYGVLLNILEAKKLAIFDCFQVIAPVNAWTEVAPEIDPIALGFIADNRELSNIWELDLGSMPGNFYFIAKW